jgi:hypothetical protein
VEPPAADGFTLYASGATRFDGRIDLKIGHARPLCSDGLASSCQVPASRRAWARSAPSVQTTT